MHTPYVTVTTNLLKAGLAIDILLLLRMIAALEIRADLDSGKVEIQLHQVLLFKQ
jgi:hypothetical protein